MGQRLPRSDRDEMEGIETKEGTILVGGPDEGYDMRAFD
jgi:hypothetical protein